MPLGAARLTLLAFQPTVSVVAEVIRRKVGVIATADVRVETDQSKFGGSSAYFPGTNGMLEISSAGNPSGTGDFTLEFWVRLSDQNRFNALYDARTGNPDNAILLYYDNRGATTILNCTIAGSTIVEDTTTGIADNTWTHIAVSRSGSSVYLFMDGTLVDTGTNSTDLDVQPGYIGLTSFNSGNDYLGYIDEFRTSSVARYTSGFTPSTTPFVNDDDTLLLMHMDGTDASTYFDDDNGVGRSAVGVVAIGNAQIDTAQYKFGGSSALFDGTGDYLKHEGGTNGSFYQISGSWTVECWFNPVTDTGDNTVGLVIVGSHPSTPNTGGGILYRNFDNKLQCSWYAYNGSDPVQQFFFFGGATITNNTWNHLAMVYDADASTWSVYLNGTRETNQSVTYSGVKLGDNGLVTIGGIGAALPLTGNIDEVRISNTARYTGASVTAPTAPFVNDADTLLLLHMDGTDASTLFLDDNGATRSRVGVSALGNAQIDTAQSYFGGASALFDGTTDYLSIDSTALSSSAFTIELWARITTKGVMSMITGYDGASIQFGMYLDSNVNLGLLTYINATATVLDSLNGGLGYSAINTGQWYHIALVKDGTSWKWFVDGSLMESATATVDWSGADRIYVGAQAAGAASWNGHIDEVRISNTARYTAAFTPSTEPFQNDANTTLLLHMDGTDASTDFVDDNGKESA